MNGSSPGGTHMDLTDAQEPTININPALDSEQRQNYVDILLQQFPKGDRLTFDQSKALNKESSTPAKKRHRQKSAPDGISCPDNTAKTVASSPGRSRKQKPKKSNIDGRFHPNQGEAVRSEGLVLLSPTPSHGSGSETSDVGFKSSLLDEVLTDKKMALLKSPEVKAFLQQQQARSASSKMAGLKKQ